MLKGPEKLEDNSDVLITQSLVIGVPSKREDNGK